MGCWKSKTGVDSVAEAVFVCCDSDYNLYAIGLQTQKQNRRKNRPRVIDDEYRAYSIIYLKF